MNAKVKEAVKATAEVALPLPQVKSEAELYAEHRAFIVEAAQSVIKACTMLADTERKVRNDWWRVLHDMAGKCSPGNGQQFGREYDAVRQQILDNLAALAEDAGRFVPSGKAETLAAKWRELEQARSGFSTFANYASQTRFWIERVKSGVDPKQSPESFGMTVRNYYTDAKAADKAGKAEGSGQRTGADGKPEVIETAEGEKVAVTSALGKAYLPAKDEHGKATTIEVRFPTEVIGALSRLTKQIGFAIKDGVPIKDIVEALQVAHDMIGEAHPANKQ